MMPFNAFLHSAYFTLRSGGKTLITFFFDAGFVWIVSIPLAMMLSRLTDMPVRVLYACCTGADLIKGCYWLYSCKTWKMGCKNR